MKRNLQPKRNLFIAFLWMLIFLPVTLLADTVLLRDGSRINGRIIQQNQASVIIVSGNRRQVISKTRIARILYNNNYGNDEDDKQKEEEERRKRLEEQRKREEAERQRRAEEQKRLEEQRRKEEERRQQEILNQIEEEKTREQEQKEQEQKEQEQREQEQREQEQRENQQPETDPSESTKEPDFFDSDLLRTLIGEEVDRHEVRFRLEGGAARIRPLFVPFVDEFNAIRGPVSNKSITSSPASYVDGASYGGEIEYLYDRFLVRVSSRRLESAYSRANYELGTTTDVLTGLPTDSFVLDLDYARDLSRVEHSFGLGITAYSNDFLEVRPVVEYLAQITESNNDGSAFGFQTSALSYFGTQTTKNRMWLRGVRGSLEVLYSFQLFGQSFEWKLSGGAIQLQGSAVSDNRGNFFDSGGSYTGQRTFRLDPKVFYEATTYNSTLYYSFMPDLRFYMGLAGQNGMATVSEPNIAQNFSGLDPLSAYLQIQSMNDSFKFGGLRDHHIRLSFGAEYRLGL